MSGRAAIAGFVLLVAIVRVLSAQERKLQDVRGSNAAFVAYTVRAQDLQATRLRKLAIERMAEFRRFDFVQMTLFLDESFGWRYLLPFTPLEAELSFYVDRYNAQATKPFYIAEAIKSGESIQIRTRRFPGPPDRQVLKGRLLTEFAVGSTTCEIIHFAPVYPNYGRDREVLRQITVFATCRELPTTQVALVLFREIARRFAFPVDDMSLLVRTDHWFLGQGLPMPFAFGEIPSHLSIDQVKGSRMLLCSGVREPRPDCWFFRL